MTAPRKSLEMRAAVGQLREARQRDHRAELTFCAWLQVDFDVGCMLTRPSTGSTSPISDDESLN